MIESETSNDNGKLQGKASLHYGPYATFDNVTGMAAGISRGRSSSGLVLVAGPGSIRGEAPGVGGVQGQEATGGVEIHFPPHTSEKQKGQYASLE